MIRVPSILAVSAAGLGAMVLTTHALAGGHYVVDDADLIDPRSCEAEIWYTDTDGAGHGTFLSPTCRLDGPWQVTATAGFLRESGSNEELYGLEAKALFMDMETHGFGVGLVAGTEYLTETSRWEVAFAYVPVSFEVVPDRAMAHINLGVERDRGEDDKTALTWGLGTEATLAGPLGFVAEVFGDDRSGSHPVAQIGPRLALLDDRLFADLTWTRELGGDREEAWTVGVIFVALNF
ncbi:hypothetical protein B1C78_11295 [Thioalkalivibrio denitrificans]|uniref:Transporter n=1 Tax=Thioalkalivibrio denitrificans TaxID=108003 RepID=A0A1V3NF12_9GAMM|nr:hypothetical protein [Thioalkalivibrio denitrificans]OOG23442.1 hypothetical protein B1C78_11295 [Thioalkalivibrio denitrificans]